ncbi:MAG: hypothetical protein JWO35_631 [Candidatus Saccharibacteria bacterium]|nr:hypothetical protein [Candidatus Saccharibacteria bacterium]
MKEDVRNHSLPTTEYWDFPGGRMQDNETILEALMREIEEETGIQEVLEPKFQAAVISNHQIKLANGTIVGLVLMLYKVKIASDAIITLSEEHLGYEWADRTVARERLQHKYPQEFTDKF